MNKKIYCVSEYAKKHNCSRQYVHELITKGRLDAVKVGSVWIIKSEKIKPVKRGRPRKKFKKVPTKYN